MKEKKNCSNCIKGTVISVNRDILCRENGVVAPNYLCGRHRPAPPTKSPRDSNYKCIDCENFILDMNGARDSAIGLCQLFSVRQFDGNQKNACSKFSRKTEIEVS